MKKFLLLTIFFVLVFLTTPAQEVIPAAGGNSSGTTGSATFSVGQVFYHFHTASTGSMAEGVQQPYEISVVTGIPEAGLIHLHVSAFPNPVMDILTLRMDEHPLENLSWHLYNLTGAILLAGKINSTETSIDMSDQTSSVYFLKVMAGNQQIKTFRIIKH
jgi:hypothetical protein